MGEGFFVVVVLVTCFVFGSRFIMVKVHSLSDIDGCVVSKSLKVSHD